MKKKLSSHLRSPLCSPSPHIALAITFVGVVVYEGKSLGEGSHKEKKMLLMCDTIKGPWEEPIGYSLGVSRSTGNSNLFKQLLLVFFMSFFYLMFGLRREGWGVKESRIELSWMKIG